MKKRIIMAVLCLSLGVGSTVLAATGPDSGTAGIQRAEECGNCGGVGTFQQIERVEERWRDTGETKRCTKYTTLFDRYQVRNYYYKYKCRKCGYPYTGPKGTETRLYCDH